MSFAKHILIFTLLLSVCWTDSKAQGTDRFIRIIGNAERSFKYETMNITVVITEVAPNEYRQTRYKPIEQIYSELLAELAKLGLNSSNLVEDTQPDFNSYSQKVRNKKYKLVLPNNFNASKLADVFIEGVVMREVKYAFATPSPNLENEMATEAINDARRKGERLAKEVGKKLGKVLNLEDKSSGTFQEMRDLNTPSTKLSYKIHITFELLD